MARRIAAVLLAAGAGWLLSGCIVSLDDEELFGKVVSQCEMPNADLIASGPTPMPLNFADGPAFLFGETSLATADAQGRTLCDNSFARVADVDAACAGDLDYTLDADGVPLQVIALNAEEQALNDTTDDRIVLWPIGAFVFEQRAVVYYDKTVLRGGDYFDGVRVGTGVCVMEPGSACVRTEFNVFDGEPTLLWMWPTPSFGSGAFIANDELAYLYSCDKHGDFDYRCRTARVDPSRVSDPAAYEYLRFNDEWSTRVEDAIDGVRDQTSMAVGWSDFTDSYITVASRLLDENVELRRAPNPWGPWDAPISLFEAVTPSSWFVGGVHVHQGLQTSDRELVLTYHSNTEGGSGNHLTRYRLADSLPGGAR